MALYTRLGHVEIAEFVADHGLGKVHATSSLTAAASSTHYLLETAKGKFLLRIDDSRGELEVKRETDLLLFLRKHGFPCPVPLPDAKGRYYRELNGKCVSLYRHLDGRTPRGVGALTTLQLGNLGRVLADLHMIGKAYKKGIDSRFSFERVAESYQAVRKQLPGYFKRVVRTLDDEVDYLRHYLEDKLPKGIVHGDLFIENVMFKGEKVVAVLDFEAAGRGKFIFDLATAVNTLCYDGAQYVLKRFEALIAGYEGLRTLSLAEWDTFPNELRFSALRFTVGHLCDFVLRTGGEPERASKDFTDFYERLRVLRREREGGMEGLLMAMATGYDYRRYQKVKAIEKKGSK